MKIDRNQYLRLMVIAGAFLVGFWLPVRMIGFTPPVYLEVIFDLIISIISGISIYLHFFDNKENPKKVKNWLNLSILLDLICVMPLSLIALVAFDSTYESILLINLLCARHIRHIKVFLDCFSGLRPITYRLVPVFLMLPLLVHLIACGWIALGSGTAGDDADKVLVYVRAVYWAFTTLTTVGYGDISAKSIPQMLYACGVQVIGVGVFGYILSNVAGLLARSDAAREHHMDNLDKIETFMNIHRIPQNLRSEIRTYYHYMWTYKKGYQEESLLHGLPTKIQSDLIAHINKPIIKKVPFLKEADPELIGELMSELKARVYVPGEKIFKVDEPGTALYFIQSGLVEIQSRTGEKIATLNEGAFFGEMALISDRPRAASAVANTFCDLYILQKHAFDRVVKHYPQFKHHIEQIMAQRA